MNAINLTSGKEVEEPKISITEEKRDLFRARIVLRRRFQLKRPVKVLRLRRQRSFKLRPLYYLQ